MYEFCYDYIKTKYQDKAKLCYMDTDILKLKIFIKIFDTSDYDENDKRQLPIGKNKKVNGLFKVEDYEKISWSQSKNVCRLNG